MFVCHAGAVTVLTDELLGSFTWSEWEALGREDVVWRPVKILQLEYRPVVEVLMKPYEAEGGMISTKFLHLNTVDSKS